MQANPEISPLHRSQRLTRSSGEISGSMKPAPNKGNLLLGSAGRGSSRIAGAVQANSASVVGFRSVSAGARVSDSPHFWCNHAVTGQETPNVGEKCGLNASSPRAQS